MLLLLRLPLVIFPSSDCEFDVFVLAALRSATQKNHDALAMLPEVNPVTRSEIDPALENSLSDALYIRKVSQAHSVQGDGHLARRLCVQPVHPLAKRAMIFAVVVFADFDHRLDGNIYFTIVNLDQSGIPT
jgi:hypothetical protein